MVTPQKQQDPVGRPRGSSAQRSTGASGNTEKIASNAVWYGFDVGFGLFTTFATSIAIARTIGPHRLGYFSYILWLVTIGANLGGVGIPATAVKYMAEYLGRGEAGIARAIFSSALRLQAAFASAITIIGLVLVLTVSERSYWASSALLVASILPGMLTALLARAHMAAENMRANLPSSIASNCLYIIGTVCSLVLGWNLVGIAASVFISRSLEVLLRFVSVGRWMRTLPSAVVPGEVWLRMRKFSGWSTMLMIVQLIVWDRSDVILLKWLSPNIAEVTFFSVAFNLTEKAMVLPQAFGLAIGVSVLAQYGRDESVLGALVSRAARYMLLFGLPFLLGLSVLSGPAIQTLYGREYLAVVPILACAAALATKKRAKLEAPLCPDLCVIEPDGASALRLDALILGKNGFTDLQPSRANRVGVGIGAFFWPFRYPDGHQTGAHGHVALAGPGFGRWFNAEMDFAWLS